MVPGGMQAVELAVEHVGKHRQRIPLTCRAVGESPGNSRPRKAPRDVRLVVDKQGIVDVRESLAECPAKHEQDGDDQETAHGNRPPRVWMALGTALGGW